MLVLAKVMVGMIGFLALARPALGLDGLMDSDRPASFVVFPYISSNSATGDDTVVQITNTDHTNDVSLECFYVSGEGESASTLQFRFYLRAGQPLQWRARTGLPEFPPPDPSLVALAQSNVSFAWVARQEIQAIQTSYIPPVAVDPFVGSLRCTAVDFQGIPVRRDVIIGSARVEHYEAGAPDSFTVATYRGIGFQTTGQSGLDPDVLVFGGPAAEYGRCARYFSFQHFAERALLETAAGPAQVSTKLVLVPCSVDLAYPGTSHSTILIDHYNEFGQASGLIETVGTQLVKNISDLGVGGGTRSIFDVTVQGTVTGRSVISVVDGSGVVGVGLEFYHVSGGPDSATAFTLATGGGYDFEDRVILPYQRPPTPLPTATPIPFTPTPEPELSPPCGGDCDGDGVVEIGDIVRMVQAILSGGEATDCANGDINGDGQLSIDEVISGITRALNGCE